MKIIKKDKNKIKFAELQIGDAYIAGDGSYKGFLCMKTSNAKHQIDSFLFNAVCLSSGQLINTPLLEEVTRSNAYIEDK